MAHLSEMVRQTHLVFGEAPFRHYDVIASLDDELSPGGGQEHLEEGENNLPSDFLTNSSQQLNNADLIVHEYVHAGMDAIASLPDCGHLISIRPQILHCSGSMKGRRSFGDV